MIRNLSRRTWLVGVVFTLLAGLLAAPAGASPEARAKATLVADYRFGGTLAGSVSGTPALVETGNGIADYVMDDQLVYQFPKGNGLDLNAASTVMPTDRYTIAILMRFDAMSSYRRLLNFYKNQRDTGMYLYDGYPYFYDYDYPYDSFGKMTKGTWFQFVLTRSGAGVLTGYMNGELRFTVDDSANEDGVIGPVEDLLRFFRDNPNNEESGGAVARIRIWDKPLSESKIAALGWLPNQKLIVDPPGAVPGDTVDVTVKGFGPNEDVKIKLWDTINGWRTLGKLTVDASGQGTKTFSIPNDTALGNQKFKAVGQTSELKKKVSAWVEFV
jgi:hypothetical protein